MSLRIYICSLRYHILILAQCDVVGPKDIFYIEMQCLNIISLHPDMLHFKASNCHTIVRQYSSNAWGF